MKQKKPSQGHPWRNYNTMDVSRQKAERQRRDARKGKRARTHAAIHRESK